MKRAISIYFHVHLVSDSTGDTLVAMMKASCVQFRNATALEHLHSLVRSDKDMERTLQNIEDKPGIVLYTLLNSDRRKALELRCSQLGIQAVSILDPTLSMLGRYLGAAMSSEIGAQRNLDRDYYKRISALDYAMSHDDGQNIDGLSEADIILLGISRTSKTPTCIYLANRGYKSGNIPLVPGAAIPEQLSAFKTPFIVGLIASPSRIVEIREKRLENLHQDKTSYTNQDDVRSEMRDAKRMFAKRGYPIVDVTRRSIEETAARIIKLYAQRQD